MVLAHSVNELDLPHQRGSIWTFAQKRRGKIWGFSPENNEVFALMLCPWFEKNWVTKRWHLKIMRYNKEVHDSKIWGIVLILMYNISRISRISWLISMFYYIICFHGQHPFLCIPILYYLSLTSFVCIWQ